MKQLLPRQRRTLVASAAVIALAANACSTIPPALDSTAGTGALTSQRGEGEWREDIRVFGARYRANPRDAEAAIRHAKALRAVGQRAQAAAVLEQAAIHNPQSQAVLGAYGRALADNGNYQQALDVLNRAHSPDQPDWRILSVQGAVLDQMGRHEDAQRHYASALRLMPDEPSILSNLGLSYALAKDLSRAEMTLRRAADRPGAEPKVRQNLALVVGLQGRFQEAETIARGDLSPAEAASNVAYLKQMLAQHKDWKSDQRSSPSASSTRS